MMAKICIKFLENKYINTSTFFLIMEDYHKKKIKFYRAKRRGISQFKINKQFNVENPLYFLQQALVAIDIIIPSDLACILKNGSKPRNCKGIDRCNTSYCCCDLFSVRYQPNNKIASRDDMRFHRIVSLRCTKKLTSVRLALENSIRPFGLV